MSAKSTNHPVSSHIDREISEFLIDRESRNLTPKSLKWYSHALGIFGAYLTVGCIETTRSVTSSTVRHFLIHLKDRGHNPGGRANIFGAVRAYLHWYKAEFELTDWNPLDRVATPKQTGEIKQPIALDDFQHLIAACKGRSFAALRDQALLLVLLDTGIRKQEITDLNYGDVNLINGEIYIRSGKGRKSRTVFIGTKTKRVLGVYLRLRKNITAESPLWATDQGTPLAYNSIRQVVRRRAAEAGIKEPGLHEFRRAFALSYLRNGGDVVTLQRLLGHASLNVVLRYLDLVKDDLQVSHGKFGPVDHLK